MKEFSLLSCHAGKASSKNILLLIHSFEIANYNSDKVRYPESKPKRGNQERRVDNGVKVEEIRIVHFLFVCLFVYNSLMHQKQFGSYSLYILWGTSKPMYN